MATQEDVCILVTGFGAFQDVSENPSFKIASRIPTSLPGGIQVIVHPEPLKAVYRSLLETSPRLIQENHPDIVLHIGLAVERSYFAVEQSAERDGYHQNLDMERKVVTKAESRSLWGKKSPERLQTTLDLEQVVEAWRRNLKPGSDGKKSNSRTATTQVTDVRLSDDVGNYVCGLVYYASLAELMKRGTEAGSAVFLHVPPLTKDEDIQKGQDVVIALIYALAEVWRCRNAQYAPS